MTKSNKVTVSLLTLSLLASLPEGPQRQILDKSYYLGLLR